MSARPTTRSTRALSAALVLAGLLAALAVCAEAATTFNIAQRAIHFSQVSITIKAGDTIHYHNQDDVTHNLMVIGADDDPEDQGLQPPGATVTHTFTQEGTFEVRCAIHPKMKMMVTVER